MAEAFAILGIIASIAQLADYGFKLSIKLYSYSETVSTADKSIKAISNDVSLTSTVLKELCMIIESDDAHVVSENAMLATRQTVDECLRIFADLDEALSKSLGAMGKLEKEVGKKINRGAATLERLKWPFKQPKMELLRSNLDRLKASLTLMLQVLSYARDISSRNNEKSSLEYQKHMIESLARSEREMQRKYLDLQLRLEPKVPGDFNAVTTTVTGSRDINDEPPAYQTPASSIRSRYPLGELLLYFQLINDFLTTTKEESQPGSPPESLQQALDLVQQLEMENIRAQYNDQSSFAKIEAMSNLQARLLNLANTDALGGIVKEQINIDDRRSARPSLLRPPSTRPGNKRFESVSTEHFEEPITYSASEPMLVDVDTDMKADTDVSDYMLPLQPASPLPSGRPSSTNSAALQAEIDETVATMRQNITKVSQRGERLDALADHTDDLSVSAQEFRRAADRARVRGSTLATVGHTIYDSIRGIGEAFYGVGSGLVEGVVGEGEVDEEEVGEDQDEEMYDDALPGLLAKWTTLPPESEKELEV